MTQGVTVDEFTAALVGLDRANLGLLLAVAREACAQPDQDAQSAYLRAALDALDAADGLGLTPAQVLAPLLASEAAAYVS